MNFCHLHLHNQYSILDGVGTSKQYAELAKSLGQTHLSITNHGNIDGVIDHQKQCKEVGIKPIIGCEMYIVSDSTIKEKKETRYHITLLVENETGWNNLLKMLSYAGTTGFYYRPRIDKEVLLNNLKGLIVLTGCSLSFLNMPDGREILENIGDTIGIERTFLEVMPHNIPEQIKINKFCQILGNLPRKNNFSLVATNDCHYPTNESALYQEVLLAIQSKKKWHDPSRWKFNCTGLYLKSYEEMYWSFADQNCLSAIEIKKALRWTTRIASMCEGFEIKQQAVSLPSIMEFKDDEEENEFLWSQIVRGMKRKLNHLSDEEYVNYSARVDEEIELIKKMKFQRYFLIVWDLINWCKKNNIMVGPGRGSVGGSLIAFLLGITDVDPIIHNLVFFRFISPDRNDLPDIDLDFEDHKRYQVREYLENKYGKNNVAGLSTFMLMKGRSVIRDVARVFDIPLNEVDVAAKAMNDDNKNNEQVKGSFENIIECKQFKHKYPKIVKIAENLEGQVRGCGQHAAALCISSEDLTIGTKCNLALRSNQIVANWDKDNAEYCGLMKLDILGLSALSVLNETKKMVKENHNVNIDFQKLSLDDQKVYDQINNGNTIGAFQIGTYGLTKYCIDLGVDNFEVLSAATALFRPGPLDSGMAEEFVKRKNGKAKIKSINPAYDKITENTYGIIVYQEQVMQVINKLSGIPMNICDKIRKVMAKSKGEEALNKYYDQFIEGCLNNKSVDKKKAKEIWKTILTFGNYAFNRSHSVEYSVITFWDMYCKTYFPNEFIACSLTFGSKEHSPKLIQESKRLRMKLKLPKIGISKAKSWIVDTKGNLYAPFISINGVGETVALNLENASAQKQKNKGFFNSDNMESTSIKGVNKNIVLILKEIGAYEKEKVFTPIEYNKIKHLFSF